MLAYLQVKKFLLKERLNDFLNEEREIGRASCRERV